MSIRTRLAAAAGLAAFCMSSAGAQALPSLPAELPPATPPPAATVPQGGSARDLLPALLTHSRSTLTLKEGRLGGEGLARLRELLRAASFVMIGEDHGNAGIADVSTALWRELESLGYTHAAIETDPWIAERLEADLRRSPPAWTALLAEQGGAMAPFFAWDAELRLAQAVVDHAAAARRSGPVLWGLDQVFIGAVPWLMQRVSREAVAEPARRLAAELARESAGNLQALVAIPEARWQALRDAVADDPPRRELMDALLLSRRIYVPNTGGPGEVLHANQTREDLMKRAFAAQLAAATAREGRVPKVLLKFGAFHLYRGASPIGVQGLGGFVSELALLHGGAALNLLVPCSPGSELLMVDGRRLPCDASRYGGDWAFLEPYLDPTAVTVFDLRSWRLRPGRVAHLAPGVQRAMASFDLLVLPPRSPAVAFLPGVKPPVMPR